MSSNASMSSKKQFNYNHKSCDKNSTKDPTIGAKSDCNQTSDKWSSNASKGPQESEDRQRHHWLTSDKSNNSHIPRYTGGRQRRHSEGPSNKPLASHSRNFTDCCIPSHGSNGAINTNECLIHGKRPESELLVYQMLEHWHINGSNVPNDIKALHKNHICSNVGKSRSVPTSNLTSVPITPLSTPSTPTDSRKMCFNRSCLSQTSTPLRQSKSSLSMTSQTTRNSNQKSFAEYMPLCEVQKGLQKGDIVEGVLRINPRNYMDAYISAPEGGLDIYVGGMNDRNRALNGDRVAVRINPHKDWKILFDIIRVNYEEWEQHFEQIFMKLSEVKGTPHPSAHNTCQTDLLTIDENIEEIDNKTDFEDQNENNINNEGVVESRAQSHSSDTNVKKHKRIRSRNRKYKKKAINESEGQKCKETNESKNTSDLRPKALKLSLNERQNRFSHENPKTFDELKERIKTLNIECLFDLTFWTKCVQRTGQVVHILEANHSRIAGGRLAHMKEKNNNWALFIPNDSRIPRMRIAMKSCPPDFVHHSQHYAQSLFIAQIDEWKLNDHFPSGKLLKHLGNAGDVEVESEMILTEHQIEFNDFPNEAFYGLPNIIDDEWTETEDHWSIPQEELNYRQDLRNECVFTIDPSTARDLDDALSIKSLNDGLFEVGVHIADVSYFLKEDIPLDAIARRRATSVYLVQKVIPMLPRLLCEKLCSLNSGEEKLTFSVVWVIDSNGNVLNEWFGRTIIRSCIKLSYELAQDMIDDPNREWKGEEMPAIHGQWSYSQISERVNLLNEIAVKLRKDRFERGSLRIDKLKLHFILDKESGLPSGFSPYIYRDSNRLVEEFMLLANMAVAHRLYKAFGDLAFLRCHPPPAQAIDDFKSFCKHNGFEVDTTSSLSLQRSLDSIINNNENVSKVVAHYLLKAMQPAEYICVGMQSATKTLHHYALNVPLYTHFTSPIRRYADVIVHRLLSVSLSYREMIPESAKDLHRMAKNCNDKKLSSRLVSESSSRLFLNIYIKQIGKIETKAIVVQVFDHSFDVMLLNCGVISRIYLDPLPLKRFTFQTQQGKNKLTLEWNDCTGGQHTVPQNIIACDLVDIQVSATEEDSMKLTALLQHPNGQYYQKEPKSKPKT